MGYKDYITRGEVPEFGAIFMSHMETKKECFRRKLFGLPSAQSNFVLQVKEGMILFLFEFKRRQLYGVFRATCDGEINIEPNAFKSSGKHFPAQVCFTQIWNCSPLAEHEFQDAIRDNYYSGKKFHFGLSEDQVHKLMMLFFAKRIPKKHTERSFWRECDKPQRKDTRLTDNTKNLVKDRIGFIREEDEVKVDDDVYLNQKFEGKFRNFSYDRWVKDNDGHFLTNNATSDRSFGGLRRVDDARVHFIEDVNDKHEMHSNLGEEIRGKHDIEDGYRKTFNEPDRKRFCEVGLESRDARFLTDGVTKINRHVMDDDNRIQDDYHVINGFTRSPCNDGSFFGHEIVESQQTTLTEHQLRRIKPDYDEDFSSKPRILTQHPMNEVRGIKPDYDKDIVFSLYKQNTLIPISKAEDPFVTEKLGRSSELNNIGKTYDSGFLHISYDPEIPRIKLKPSSYLATGPSCSPVDYPPSYASSKDIIPSLSTSESLSYHSQNERWNDDPGYAFSSKSDNTDSCHETRLNAYDNRYLAENRSNYVHEVRESKSKKLSSFEEDPIHRDKKLCKPRDCTDNDKRLSVFARLTLAPPAKENDIDKKHVDLDASVNKVMKMLEKVVSSPIKRTSTVFKKDDNMKHTITANKITNDKLSKVKIELDANLANEVIESGSILKETRLVDFKRRKKPNNSLDDKFKDNNSECNKRRKLVRPVFVIDDLTSSNTHIHENTPLKDESDSTKTVEACEKSVTERVENGLVSDALVEEAREEGGIDTSSTKENNGKTCGWIEW